MIPTQLPSLEFAPKRVNPPGLNNWTGHLPFARDLIASLRPDVIVELGVHFGESYFAFCQAVAETAIDCKCYAVDTWLGDGHAGFYTGGVFDDVKEYNQQNYAHFSQLLRMTFDEALSRFPDASISLLHIDGLHTYDAVSHDFSAWWAKVRPGGLVLLHDICARHADFGVWRLWEELQREYRTLTFHHSWGLGVVQKPGATVHELLALNSPDHDSVRSYYSMCGERVLQSIEASRRALGGTGRAFLVQSWLDNSESPGPSEWVLDGRSQNLTMTLRVTATEPRVELSLLHDAGIAEVKRLRIRCSNAELWDLATGRKELQLGGNAVLLPSTDLTVLSYGNYHRLLLPRLLVGQCELTLELELSITSRLDSVAHMLADYLDSCSAERRVSLDKIRRIEHELERATSALDEAQRRGADREAHLEAATAALGTVSRERDALLSSWSWQLTQPVRAIATVVGYGRSPKG